MVVKNCSVKSFDKIFVGRIFFLYVRSLVSNHIFAAISIEHLCEFFFLLIL